MSNNVITKTDTVQMPGIFIKQGDLIAVDTASPEELAREMETKISASLFEASTAVSREEIDAAKGEVDFDKTTSIVTFGASASEQATATSRELLEGAKNMDVGAVGKIMSDMMLSVRSLDPKDLKGGGLFGWLKSHASRATAFLQKYESVKSQIDQMAAESDNHRRALMTSVAGMDRLYDATVFGFHRLEVYILAGNELLDHMNTDVIPPLKLAVDMNTDGPNGIPAALVPQTLRDQMNKRDQLERQVSDLIKVRMVNLQTMPRIRLGQDTDSNLIAKLNSIKVMTIPLWNQQMALALAAVKTKEAAEFTTMVADATDDMLVKGAEEFRDAQKIARESVERGIVSVEAVEAANKALIEAIEETDRITKEGKAARASAETSMLKMEAALRLSLSNSETKRTESAV